MTLNINDSQHNKTIRMLSVNMLSVSILSVTMLGVTMLSETYAECNYAECQILFNVMPNAVMLNVIIAP